MSITFAINTAFLQYSDTVPTFYIKHVFIDKYSFHLDENNTLVLPNLILVNILPCRSKTFNLKIAHPRAGSLKVIRRGLKLVEYCKTCKNLLLIQKLFKKTRKISC